MAKTSARFQMGVSGAEEYARLADRLRAEGSGLQEHLRSAIRSTARPVERDIKAAARATRVTGTKGGRGRPKRHRQLRLRTAAAVSTSVTRTGIRFVVDGRKVDPVYGGALVRYLDADTQLGRYKRWRFPVFHSGAWSQNRSSGGFFLDTIRRRRTSFEKAVRDVCDRVAQRITR